MNGLLRLQDYLTVHQYDGILLLSQTNLRYFAGFTGTTAVGFVTPYTAFILTDSRYTEQAQNQCEGYEVIQYKGSTWETIAEIAKTRILHCLFVRSKVIMYRLTRTKHFPIF